MATTCYHRLSANLLNLVAEAADARARGFLLGATAGRTTLNGEGLQHQDWTILSGYWNIHAEVQVVCFVCFSFVAKILIRLGLFVV